MVPAQQIQVHVLFFATIRSIIGRKTLDVQLPVESSVADLKAEISRLYPEAAQTMQLMLASVNQVFSPDETVLSDGDVVAFFPHVGGGWCE